jgi:hypothetical protein
MDTDLISELFALHEHARRAAARIVDSPGGQHERLDWQVDSATLRAKPATASAVDILSVAPRPFFRHVGSLE